MMSHVDACFHAVEAKQGGVAHVGQSEMRCRGCVKKKNKYNCNMGDLCRLMSAKVLRSQHLVYSYMTF